MTQTQLIPFRAVSRSLPFQPRSVYQAHRRGTADFLLKKKNVDGKESGQWLFDPLKYEAQVLEAGRQVPEKTREAIRAAQFAALKKKKKKKEAQR